MKTMHITHANKGQHVLFGADVVTIKAGSDLTSGSMLVFELRVPAGGGPPTLHRHGYSEVFYLLSGEFMVSTLDDDNALQTATLTPGDTIAIPSMVWHTFKNVGSTPAKLLAIHSPPVMEALIHEIGRVIDSPDDPPAPSGPPSEAERQHFLQVIGKYMEMLPPEAITR